MFDENLIQWFAIRVSYGRVVKFCASLQDAGIEHFLPMTRKRLVRNGRTVTQVVPAIANLCFVRTSRNEMDLYLARMGENSMAHYMWDKATRKPMVVSEKSMNDFIQICTIMSDEVLYLKDITTKLSSGQKVRVVNGPFKGVEGIILRVKRSRRLVVDFPGLLAVATSYVDPRDIEVIQ